ncbi:hypothetical protein QL285_084658 [Trifolium repens]|nr:hypothetical protein QL285_084658 [Trifolium repens]
MAVTATGTATFSSSSLSTVYALQNRHASQNTTFQDVPLSHRMFLTKRKQQQRFVVVAVTKGSAESSKSDEKIPSWAKPDSDEPPPWAKNEAQNKTGSEQGFEIPFYVYLLASAITAIAAIGSIFEYVNQKPVFGVLSSDSIFYAPLLGFFAFTGVPTSAFLWFKSVQAANKEAEEQDRRDGY